MGLLKVTFYGFLHISLAGLNLHCGLSYHQQVCSEFVRYKLQLLKAVTLERGTAGQVSQQSRELMISIGCFCVLPAFVSLVQGLLVASSLLTPKRG